MEIIPLLHVRQRSYDSLPLSLQHKNVSAFAIRSQWFALGFIYAILYAMQFSVFNTYLGMDGDKLAAYAALLMLPTCLKPFFHIWMKNACQGTIMFFGWSLVVGSLFAMAITPFNRYRDTNQVNCVFNHIHALLSCSTLLGAVVVMVGMEKIAPHTESSMVDNTFFIGSTLAYSLIGVALNDHQFGGSFGFALTPNNIYLIAMIPSMAALLIAMVKLDKIQPKSASYTFASWWERLQQLNVLRLCAFHFIFALFSCMDSTSFIPISVAWTRVEPLFDAISRIWMGVVIAIVFAINYGEKKKLIVEIGSFMTLAIEAVLLFGPILSGSQHQLLYCGILVLRAIASSLRFLTVVSSAMGDEVVCALILTASTMGSFTAITLYRSVDSYFPAPKQQLLTNKTLIQSNVTSSFQIAIACRVIGVVLLVLFPQTKQELSTHLYVKEATLFVGIVVMAFIISTISSIAAFTAT